MGTVVKRQEGDRQKKGSNEEKMEVILEHKDGRGGGAFKGEEGLQEVMATEAVKVTGSVQEVKKGEGKKEGKMGGRLHSRAELHDGIDDIAIVFAEHLDGL